MQMYLSPLAGVKPPFQHKISLNRLSSDAFNWLKTREPLSYQDRYYIQWAADSENNLEVWFECETSAILFKLKYGDS